MITGRVAFHPTRSTPTTSEITPFHYAQVRIGISDSSRVPGLMRERPRRSRERRSGTSLVSMVAADIDANNTSVSVWMLSSPDDPRIGTRSVSAATLWIRTSVVEQSAFDHHSYQRPDLAAFGHCDT